MDWCVEQLVDSDGDGGIAAFTINAGQTTSPLQTTFIIESISKTNNNILLTGGQWQYYPTKKRGMPLVCCWATQCQLCKPGKLEFMMSIYLPWLDNDRMVAGTLLGGIQSYLPSVWGDTAGHYWGSWESSGQVIKIFWDTALLSVTGRDRKRKREGNIKTEGHLGGGYLQVER